MRRATSQRPAPPFSYSAPGTALLITSRALANIFHLVFEATLQHLFAIQQPPQLDCSPTGFAARATSPRYSSFQPSRRPDTHGRRARTSLAMPPQSQTRSRHRPQGRSNSNGSSGAASSTGATAGSSRSSSVAGQPNTQQQPAQAGGGQAGGLASANSNVAGTVAGSGAGDGARNGSDNVAGNVAGNGGGNGGSNRAADFWNPPLPGANAFGFSSPGEGFGGPSRNYTVVQRAPYPSNGRPVIHNYPNGAANRSAADGTCASRRN